MNSIPSQRSELSAVSDPAVFAFRKDAIVQNGMLPDKMTLFHKLRERDITPLVSLNAEAAFGDGSVEVNRLVDEKLVRPIGSIALEGVGVIVNRLDRSVKKDELALATREGLPPLINENELRSLVFRKNRVADEVLADLGIGMPTRLIENEDDIAAFIDQNDGTEYIVKPNSGTFSKGVVRLKPEQIAGHIAAVDGYSKTIIQPAYDFRLPFNSGIRPYDSRSHEDFERFAHSRDVKELRMYGFTSPGGTAVFPVARSMNDGDHWFFVDPDSLPASLGDDTRKVFEKAATISGSKAVYGALDIGYGSRAGEDPDYHVVELNGRAPYMVGFDKHPGIAGKLRDMFADQIRATIDDRKPAR